MKALSLTQPWASALFIRQPDGRALKGIETRSWKTNFTGRVAVHASKGFPKWAREFAETERALGRLPGKLPFGAIIGFVTIMGMRMTEDLCWQIAAIERLYGDYSAGRWGWMLCDPVLLDQPIPCKGSLGLWEVPSALNLKEEKEAVRTCKVCGCTDDKACRGGCWWVTPDLCSACLTEEVE